ncbi:MAG: nicotinate (nicotinamide) nucleotide adenylyltransferase [Chloroflexi bacterium]|nr:MAG: nicotinate (nicotinamide) nucleotide adenylyltransferase [Chloroflexota bacterium]
MRIGILGGTFDPIHLGHLAAARAAIECADLDRVLLIPTGQPPHRSAAVASAEQRLEMCRLAIGTDKTLEVSDVEIRRGGVSYTAETLKELKRIYPHNELFLILGWDAARLFATWRVPEEIRHLATVVVVTRPGSGSPEPAALPSAGLDPAKTILCVRSTPDISGSALRRAIANREPVGDRLPAAVEQYIAQKGLYGDNR